MVHCLPSLSFPHSPSSSFSSFLFLLPHLTLFVINIIISFVLFIQISVFSLQFLLLNIIFYLLSNAIEDYILSRGNNVSNCNTIVTMKLKYNYLFNNSSRNTSTIMKGCNKLHNLLLLFFNKNSIQPICEKYKNNNSNKCNENI